MCIRDRFKLTLTVSGDSQGLPPSNADGKDFSYVSKKAKVAEACSACLLYTSRCV